MEVSAITLVQQIRSFWNIIGALEWKFLQSHWYSRLEVSGISLVHVEWKFLQSHWYSRLEVSGISLVQQIRSFWNIIGTAD